MSAGYWSHINTSRYLWASGAMCKTLYPLCKIDSAVRGLIEQMWGEFQFSILLLLDAFQLLGRSSGFVVAPTHRPCTKGLWMWSAPLKRKAPDGSEYNLLLLDSEGIDAYDQTVSCTTWKMYRERTLLQITISWELHRLVLYPFFVLFFWFYCFCFLKVLDNFI